ncbi:MAG TPA: hypothetical protein VK897_10760 [Anaerolineales bacterium]|nr:hypothetical protein [Anaerolineales bacterium]
MKHTALEEVFLSPLTRRRHRRGAAGGPLIVQEPLEDADRGVERPAGRAVFLLAVPPAVVHLLAEQTLHEAPALRVLAEVRADRHDPSVDARLHLALEERLIVPPMPGHVVTDQPDSAMSLRAGRVKSQVPQPHERKKTGPLRIGRVPAPVTIGFLAGEQPGAPALSRNLRPLDRHRLIGRIGQVSHDLPADRRVRIKQPVCDRSLWLRDLPFRWMGRHLHVPPYFGHLSGSTSFVLKVVKAPCHRNGKHTRKY